MSIEYVRPTKVWQYFKEKGIRVAGEAKQKIIEKINQMIPAELDKIIDKLPKFTKGQSKGEAKRKTLKAEDI
jgi:uncharacterized spore protein YtfJ